MILAVLQADRAVDVADLAGRFGVTEMTIRRDLAELDRAGQLRRVHGGAVLRAAPAFGSRADVMSGEKERIAELVAELVAEDESVGIDTGTTCRAVAARLADRNDLTVVTYSLHAASEFRQSAVRTMVLGGMLTPEMTLVNGAVADAPPSVHLNSLVLECGGLSAQPGVTHFDPAEVAVRRSLAQISDRVVLAADHTKCQRKTAIVFGALNAVDVLITDTRPPADLQAALDAAGVEVHVAG